MLQCWDITSSRMAQKWLRPDVVTQIPCPSQLCEYLTPLSLNPPTHHCISRAPGSHFSFQHPKMASSAS